MYQAHKARIPQVQQQQAAARRHPLASAGNNPVNHQHTPPKSLPKPPPSPPLPRQNSRTTPPSPPKIITDKTGRFHFNRVGFLGEVSLLKCDLSWLLIFVLDFQGGFARVYEVKNARGTRYACKVVTKSSLKTKKAKTKVSISVTSCTPPSPFSPLSS